MSRSPISEQFYSNDKSFSNDVKSAIYDIGVPPQKMPNDLVNDARVHNALSMPSTASVPHSKNHGALNLPNFNFNKRMDTGAQDALFSSENQKRANEDILFFKSVSSNGATISKDYLPPPLPQKSRNPIIISEECVKGAPYDEISDDDDNDYNIATGQWTSPVVKEALRRQVSKEKQFKTLWMNVARLFVFHLSLLLLDCCVKFYNVRYYDVNTVYRNTWWTRLQTSTSAEYVRLCTDWIYSNVVRVQWIFLVVIFVNLLKLLKPQDQCWDLPLTESQRKLIGLTSSDSSSDKDDSVFVMKQRSFANQTNVPLVVPKYPKTNKSSGIIHRVRNSSVEEEIALQNVIPRRRLVNQTRNPF